MSISGQQNINIGLPNQSVGSDSLYTAFNKTQQNFNNLFACALSYSTLANGAGIGIANNPITGQVTITNTGVTSLIAGQNISISTATGDIVISASGGGGGGGTPGGSNTQVQFNNAGSFGASSGFTYNQVTNILTVTGNISGRNINGNLSGNGSAISSLNASNISTGTLPRAQAPSLSTRTVGSNTTVTPNDNLIVVISTATITLPPAGSMPGIPIQIQNAGPAVTVTVVPTGPDLINGDTSAIFTNQYSLFGFLSTGTSWVIF